MRSNFRVVVVALLVCALSVVLAPAAAQASFGIEEGGFTATNCKASAPGCAGVEVPTGPPFEAPYWFPKEPSHEEAVEQGFTQAGGRVPNGVTDFIVKTDSKTKPFPHAKPEGAPVNHVRVDVASGLATAPAAVPNCSAAEFGNVEPLPGTGFYPAPTCAKATEIGSEKVTLWVESATLDLPLEGIVYNLVQPEGLASLYGAALKLPIAISSQVLKNEYFPFLESIGKAPPKKVQEEAEEKQYYAHSMVKGNVEWGQEAKGTGVGDYHDYFEVEVSTALPLISSRQELFGTSGRGDFITNATSCPGDNTTFVTLENTAKEVVRAHYTTPIGLKGCNLGVEKPKLEKEGITGIEQLPFAPSFSLASGSSLSDTPNQITTEVSVPNDPAKIAQSQVKTASVKLPEGMTLNPSAANGLEACTPAQARIHSPEFGVACPAGSEVGTVSLNVPTLPDGSFTGSMYLGGPESGPITSPPYTLYVVANSKRYGVSVRVKAEVIPDPVTGQVTTVFNENPEQPFTSLALHFNRGALTSVANPLVCGAPTGTTSFVPVGGTPASAGSEFGVPITGCAASIPFALAQGVEYENNTAGAHTSYAFKLARTDGQQYLEKVKTSLPLGVVGEIPTVTQCPEAQANAGTCPSSSKIGTATVQSGSGPGPITNTGNVYLTGKYAGAPYGLSIVVPATAGPFNLGNVVTRSTINIDQKTARVTAESTLPTIVKGIPLRLRSLNININRQGFALNPTNCAVQPEGTSSTLTSTFKTVQSPLNTPFQVEGCGSLGFKPTFAASTSGKPTKNTGASLVTNITMPGGNANIKSVKVTLPKQLPSRGSTLQKACLEVIFNANPYACSNESMVGTATVVTPTLPGKMKGPAYLVSHGGAGFPNLELVLEDQGVRVILEGKTDIKNGITTTTFASSPDVPVTSVEVNLPQGPHSALGAFGSLCKPSLVLPTTIVGQNGKTFKQNTPLKPTGCGVQIVGSKVIGNTAYLTVKTFAAGRISGSGHGSCNACIKQVARTLGGAANAASLKVHLSNFGAKKHKPFKTQIRVGFLPKKKGPHSQAFITVKFH